MGSEERGKGLKAGLIEIIIFIYVIVLLILVGLDISGYNLPWWL